MNKTNDTDIARARSGQGTSSVRVQCRRPIEPQARLVDVCSRDARDSRVPHRARGGQQHRLTKNPWLAMPHLVSFHETEDAGRICFGGMCRYPA